MLSTRVLLSALGLACLPCLADDAAADPSTPKSMAVADLLKVQATVQGHLAQVRKALVTLRHGDGTASGVIVSPDGLILTAAHVTMKPGGRVSVVLPDGKTVLATALGLDTSTDAGLAQMRDQKKVWPFVEVERDVSRVTTGDWCFALGHPGGWDKERGPVLRVGRILKRTANSLQTDCVLMGGDSGGPLLDLNGRVIGIHSQIWTGRDQNMHVSMAPFLRSWDRMKGNEVIHTWTTGSGGYLGVVAELAEGGALTLEDVVPDSPAARAGLRSGDVLLELNREALLDDRHFSNFIRNKAAGDLITLKIRRAEAERVVEVKLGQRPMEDVE